MTRVPDMANLHIRSVPPAMPATNFGPHREVGRSTRALPDPRRRFRTAKEVTLSAAAIPIRGSSPEMVGSSMADRRRASRVSFLQLRLLPRGIMFANQSNDRRASFDAIAREIELNHPRRPGAVSVIEKQQLQPRRAAREDAEAD